MKLSLHEYQHCMSLKIKCNIDGNINMKPSTEISLTISRIPTKIPVIENLAPLWLSRQNNE